MYLKLVKLKKISQLLTRVNFSPKNSNLQSSIWPVGCNQTKNGENVLSGKIRALSNRITFNFNPYNFKPYNFKVYNIYNFKLYNI